MLAHALDAEAPPLHDGVGETLAQQGVVALAEILDVWLERCTNLSAEVDLIFSNLSALKAVFLPTFAQYNSIIHLVRGWSIFMLLLVFLASVVNFSAGFRCSRYCRSNFERDPSC